MKTAFATTLILSSALAATAHLGTLTTPKAGETYKVGSTVAVKWTVDQPHGTQDLSYSKVGGPWVNITTGLGNRVGAYSWLVPAAAEGANIRFRVCQRNGGTGCTDAHSTNSPETAIKLSGGGEIYTLVSGNFTVSAPTAVHPVATFEGASMAFRPESRSVEVAFSLANPERVTLEAFDAQGKRLIVLLDDRKSEGRHVLSVFSHALNSTIPFLLRLRAGDKILQQTMEPRGIHP